MKFNCKLIFLDVSPSPSLGREWIEIANNIPRIKDKTSPSLGREWIEIMPVEEVPAVEASPSLGREWIEMCQDRSDHTTTACLPPWGGSGLKYSYCVKNCPLYMSPSLGREWIEIKKLKQKFDVEMSPSLGREWIEIAM